MKSEYLEKNKKAWDLRTNIHVNSSFYGLNQFLEGKSTLNKPELDLLGDITKKNLLHLQCHFGLDTMSYSRMGAYCTGLDLSTDAIEKAKQLKSQLGLNTVFIADDVHNIDKLFNNQFDIVVTTYGVLCWLYDLPRWATGIKKSLKKNGRFILVDFHPMLDIFLDGTVSGHKRYFTKGKSHASWAKNTYADPSVTLEYLEYRWQHNIGDITNVLIDAGLTIESLLEYPYTPYNLFDDMDICQDGLWSSSKHFYPYLFSVTARNK